MREFGDVCLGLALQPLLFDPPISRSLMGCIALLGIFNKITTRICEEI